MTELSQQQISAEIAEVQAAAHAAATAAAPLPIHPLRDYAPYRSSTLRHPTHELIRVDPEEIERTAPAFGHVDVDPYESDLTIQHGAEPLGERIIVTGRVLDGDGRPV